MGQREEGFWGGERRVMGSSQNPEQHKYLVPRGGESSGEVRWRAGEKGKAEYPLFPPLETTRKNGNSKEDQMGQILLSSLSSPTA